MNQPTTHPIVAEIWRRLYAWAEAAEAARLAEQKKSPK
jgi:hypothetical protein